MRYYFYVPNDEKLIEMFRKGIESHNRMCWIPDIGKPITVDNEQTCASDKNYVFDVLIEDMDSFDNMKKCLAMEFLLNKESMKVVKFCKVETA